MHVSSTLVKLLVLLSFLGTPAFAGYDAEHAAFTKILAAHVKSGVVDYRGIKQEIAALDAYIADLASVTAADFAKMRRDEQAAYLINAYNAFTLKLIADHYPVASIRDIGGKIGGGLFSGKSKQWKVSEYEVNGKKVQFTAMGKPVTLDEIEHDNLRAKFKDPRVHFALVCGAVSCPFLRSEAYTAKRISEQLDSQGKQFLADPFRNRLDEKKNVLYLSKIFDWFGGDFKKSGSLYSFVQKYLPARTTASAAKEPSIEFLDYDWSLNDKAGKLN